MVIKDREEVQAQRINNVFKKIIAESDPNLEKELPNQIQEASWTPNRLGQNRTSP
jgi:hypothetical protein